MPNLIDRDELLKKKYLIGHKGKCAKIPICVVYEDDILNAPTVELRQHGEWVIKEHPHEPPTWHCPICDSIDRDIGIPKFCRICGAELDDPNEEEDE